MGMVIRRCNPLLCDFAIVPCLELVPLPVSPEQGQRHLEKEMQVKRVDKFCVLVRFCYVFWAEYSAKTLGKLRKSFKSICKFFPTEALQPYFTTTLASKLAQFWETGYN